MKKATGNILDSQEIFFSAISSFGPEVISLSNQEPSADHIAFESSKCVIKRHRRWMLFCAISLVCCFTVSHVLAGALPETALEKYQQTRSTIIGTYLFSKPGIKFYSTSFELDKKGRLVCQPEEYSERNIAQARQALSHNQKYKADKRALRERMQAEKKKIFTRFDKENMPMDERNRLLAELNQKKPSGLMSCNSLTEASAITKEPQ